MIGMAGRTIIRMKTNKIEMDIWRLSNMSSKETEKTTFIKNARIFDGERVLDKRTVIIKGEKIINVGGPAPSGAEIVDAKGCTLLPGLIDAHSHPKMDTLKFSLTFGVTTTFQMQGFRPK
jgi:predicted amidohydrolase YtcJ